MAIIRRKGKTNDIRYQVKVRDQFGKWFKTGTFGTKVEAEAFERKLLSLCGIREGRRFPIRSET